VTDAAPPALVSHPVVLLRRGPTPDLPEERLEELQRQHLAHLAALAEAGDLVVFGPCSDQPDESLRGICVFRRDLSVDEVRRLAGADPSVQAGRLAVEALLWWTAEGSLTVRS
jgi:uncharacterized protein YciI